MSGVCMWGNSRLNASLARSIHARLGCQDLQHSRGQPAAGTQTLAMRARIHNQSLHVAKEILDEWLGTRICRFLRCFSTLHNPVTLVNDRMKSAGPSPVPVFGPLQHQQASRVAAVVAAADSSSSPVTGDRPLRTPQGAASASSDASNYAYVGHAADSRSGEVVGWDVDAYLAPPPRTAPRVCMAYLDLGNRFSSECILLLHGEPSHGMLYRKMTPTLVSAGFRVIVPDLIGFGQSDKFGKQSTYTYDR